MLSGYKNAGILRDSMRICPLQIAVYCCFFGKRAIGSDCGFAL
jgi:hypothetical protein